MSEFVIPTSALSSLNLFFSQADRLAIPVPLEKTNGT